MSNIARIMQQAAAGAAGEALAIEDVFSTYLYTGNGSTQTITNGIDLAGEGGLVWFKARSGTYGTSQHALFDTDRGVLQGLASSLTSAEATEAGSLTAFNSDGFDLGSWSGVNGVGSPYASWTFRKAPRFFDVVTYAGTGANRTVAHNLGVVPGCIIVKRTNATGDWQVYHRSNTAAPETDYLVLNSTAATVDDNTRWNDTAPTSTVFSLGTNATVNASGATYVAYLFAHDPLGPSGDGSDGLIACGSFVTNSSGGLDIPENIGFEPQFVLLKSASGTGNWFVKDVMRGMSNPITTFKDATLFPNLSNAETDTITLFPTATGFGTALVASNSGLVALNAYIYIAIRRGPMREPTSGTEVFSPTLYTGTNVDNRLVNTGLLTDMAWVRQRNDAVLGGMVVGDRLRGQPYLLTRTTAAEVNDADSFDQEIVSAIEYGTAFSSHVGFYVGNDVTSKLNANTTSNNHVAYSFRRAPGFFDAVAYTGNSSTNTLSHNLGVAPEMIWYKARNGALNWRVHANITSGGYDRLVLDSTNAKIDTETYGATKELVSQPTATQLVLGNGSGTNNSSAYNYIAYLFATLPGVSKVGSYTGNGSSQTINCGFTGGARFVLIKRTDSTGDWYVWDTARGIVAGNDPHLSLNTTAAEVTTNDSIDPDNSGFIVNQLAATNINVSSASYIYLAIA